MKTDVTIVLDRSASMGGVREETIGGFNKFLADQKAQEGEVVLTLNQFDTEFETVFDAVPIAEIPELDHDRFVPRGFTALLDAIGFSIRQAEKREGCPTCGETKRIFVIITDGHENASKEYTSGVGSLITEKRTEGWEFVFLGANQDAIATAKAFAIPAGNALSYASTNKGTSMAFESVSRCMTSYRSGDHSNVTNYFDDQARSEQDSEISS